VVAKNPSMQKRVPAEQSKVNLCELRRKPGESLELFLLPWCIRICLVLCQSDL